MTARLAYLDDTYSTTTSTGRNFSEELSKHLQAKINRKI